MSIILAERTHSLSCGQSPAAQAPRQSTRGWRRLIYISSKLSSKRPNMAKFSRYADAGEDDDVRMPSGTLQASSNHPFFSSPNCVDDACPARLLGKCSSNISGRPLAPAMTGY
jgi:hypothetical protein